MTSAPEKIVLASNNPGKLKEFSELLAPLGITIIAQKTLGVDDADETGLSFIENAILKARHAAHITGLPAIADDSGLEVDALHGAPGIYSARFGGVHGDNANNNHTLLKKMAGIKQRSARYQCLLAYMSHSEDPTPIVTQGSWQGSILEAPQGDGGFGYDPLFWLEEHQCSAAELPKEVKSKLSHRAKASADLINQFKSLYS